MRPGFVTSNLGSIVCRSADWAIEAMSICISKKIQCLCNIKCSCFSLLPYSLVHMHTASFWNIIIQLTSHDDLTEKLVSLVSSAKLGNWKKKVVKWQKFKTALCDLTEKTVSVEFCQLAVLDWDFISIWKPNPCMDPLEKKIYYISIYSIFCRTSPPDWFKDLCQIFVLSKFDGSSFFVKLQSTVLYFCHFTSFSMETRETNFSVKLSWKIHWIIMFQKDVVWCSTLAKNVQKICNVIYVII